MRIFGRKNKDRNTNDKANNHGRQSGWSRLSGRTAKAGISPGLNMPIPSSSSAISPTASMNTSAQNDKAVTSSDVLEPATAPALAIQTATVVEAPARNNGDGAVSDSSSDEKGK